MIPGIPGTADHQREQFRDLELQMMRTANPVKYNQLLCQRIHDRSSRISLPKLSRPDLSKLKDHLKGHEKMDGKGMRYTFLNLRNCFLIINKFEDEVDMRDKIVPILRWIDEFKYVFDLIIEAQGQRESPMLDKALIILHLDITEFDILYSYLLTDVDVNPSDFAPIEIAETPYTPPTPEERGQYAPLAPEPESPLAFPDEPETYEELPPVPDDAGYPDDYPSEDDVPEIQTEESDENT